MTHADQNQTLHQALNYTPVPSRFGTSGVRALVKDLTDLEVYCLTVGTLRYLRASGRLHRSGGVPAGLAIPLAGDLRSSTQRLLAATARGILDEGYALDYVGRIPTPALTYYALQRGVASLVITGSHIPADRNGQKANRCDGEVMKSDEQGIVEAVEAVRQAEYARPFEACAFDASGMLRPGHRPELPAPNGEAARLYRERYRAVFPAGALAGMRIVFFQYAAVGRDLLPEILDHSGAQVIPTARSETFVPIDTEAISDEHLEMLAGIVAEQAQVHGPIDALVSTDGDSDRPLVIGVSGAHGAPRLRFFPGDLVGIVVADYLGADSVTVPISANPAVQEHFQAKGIVTRKTRIGSPYVIEAMREAQEAGARRVVAWEANGGFLLGSDIALGGGTLAALPSRDATLPILATLYAAAQQGGGLDACFDALPRWYGRAGLLDDFPREVSQQILAHFALPLEDAVWAEFQAEAIVLKDIAERPVAQWSLDDPGARGLLERKTALEELFHPGRGFARIRALNTQDGIRCLFDNDEIAHVRPSGNAPQLRIYAYARSQARADAIVAMGIAEPDGILGDLQRWILTRVAQRRDPAP
jgi:phosphomannomutase